MLCNADVLDGTLDPSDHLVDASFFAAHPNKHPEECEPGGRRSGNHTDPSASESPDFDEHNGGRESDRR